MENPQIQIKEKIKPAIESYFNQKGKIQDSIIHSVEWIYIDDIRNLPANSKLYSGSDIIIFVNGTVRIMAKIEGGRRGVNHDFMVSNMKIIFNSTNEDFQVVDFGTIV